MLTLGYSEYLLPAVCDAVPLEEFLVSLPLCFQQGLRDSTARCRSLEEQLLSLRLSEGDKDCQLKELEYSKRALEQEVQSLKLQVRAHLAGCSS